MQKSLWIRVSGLLSVAIITLGLIGIGPVPVSAASSVQRDTKCNSYDDLILYTHDHDYPRVCFSGSGDMDVSIQRVYAIEARRIGDDFPLVCWHGILIDVCKAAYKANQQYDLGGEKTIISLHN